LEGEKRAAAKSFPQMHSRRELRSSTGMKGIYVGSNGTQGHIKGKGKKLETKRKSNLPLLIR